MSSPTVRLSYVFLSFITFISSILIVKDSGTAYTTLSVFPPDAAALSAFLIS